MNICFSFNSKTKTNEIHFFSKGQKNPEMFVHKKNETLTSLARADLFVVKKKNRPWFLDLDEACAQ